MLIVIKDIKYLYYLSSLLMYNWTRVHTDVSNVIMIPYGPTRNPVDAIWPD